MKIITIWPECGHDSTSKRNLFRHQSICVARKFALENIELRQKIAKGEEFESCKRKRSEDDRLVTIYKLMYVPDNMCMYVGSTVNPELREKQHKQNSSKCRLVRNAIRNFGKDAFRLEPIMRCHVSDRTRNESYWMIKLNTLYPNGYNLQHTSAAGEENTFAMVESCTGIIPFQNISDEMKAISEAWNDLSLICSEIETTNDTRNLLKEMILKCHPDKNKSSYTSEEVTTMLNSLREIIR